MLAFSLSSLVAFFAAILLPETANKELPATVAEAEEEEEEEEEGLTKYFPCIRR